MNTLKEKQEVNFRVDTGTSSIKKWSESDILELKNQAKENSRLRSHEQKLKNELLAFQYEIEEYLNSGNSTSKTLTIHKVVTNYLDILNLSFRKFAVCLDTTDGNLKKYMTGERKFNTDLAMKFSSFFHTSPEIWLHLQLKNELIQLNKDKKQKKLYQKYDYTRVIEKVL